jgi:hypothetical protein
MNRADAVTYEIVDGRAILIDPKGAELLTLNAVGTLIWEALDGVRDAPALAAHLSQNVRNVNPGVAQNDIEQFLNELRQLGLVTG